MGTIPVDDRSAGTVRAARREPLHTRLAAAVLRRALRLLLLPTLRAGRPIREQRHRLERISRLTLPPRGVDYQPRDVGGVPGECVFARRRVTGPGHDAGSRAVLYLHGGAYCVGSPRTHRAITGRIATLADAHVFAIDYRLAPEHPFPAALEDAVAAFRGVLAMGYAPSQVSVAGDSAGGGLAVATAVRLRELGLGTPAALVLFSPWVDLRRQYPGPPAANEVMLDGAWIAECAGFYTAATAGSGARSQALPGTPAMTLASPITADLGALPPTLIQVGGDELLLEDSQRLHAALLAAGTRAELQVYANRWHVFQLNAGVLADADRALALAAGFLRECAVPGARF